MPSIHHRYLIKTLTNPQPPGFADFLRGSIALAQLCAIHSYEFKLDISSHPIFTLLDIPEEFTSRLDYAEPTLEILPPIPYDGMKTSIVSHLKGESDLNILTNAFYDEGSVETQYKLMRTILQPSQHLIAHIEDIKNSTAIDYTQRYVIIHIRLGDKYLVNKNDIPSNIIHNVRYHVERIIQEHSRVLLLADSFKLKEQVKDLCQTTLTAPIHTGSLDIEGVEDRMLNTLGEFFIMSKASQIYCLNFYDGSGYSRICSKIYSIPYHCISL
jgi:hypothetical protein